MKQSDLKTIIDELLHQSEYVSSFSLAFSMSVSKRTMLKYLGELKEELKQSGAILETKQGYGCRLIIEDQETFDAYYECLSQKLNHHYETPNERRQLLLLKLLSTSSYLNIYDLADEMYVSPSSLRKDIHALIPLIEHYDLILKHSHNNGYMIVGDEKHIRMCISHECMEAGYTSVEEKTQYHRTEFLNLLHTCISQSLSEFNIATTSDSINSLAIHILIAINRIETNNILAYDPSFDEIQQHIEYQAALRINDFIAESFQIKLPQNELCYFSFHINGKKRTLISFDNEDSEETENSIIFYNLFLRGILRSFQLNLFDDVELQTNLLTHIPPFLVRCKNHMQVRKSNLSMLKDEFPYAYELAVAGLSYVFKDHSTNISEEEALYFSLHLALALEKNGVHHHKYNIAVISNDAIAIFKLLSYKLSNCLAHRINIIKLFAYEEINESTMEEFDILINTTNMKLGFDKPTLSTKQFLSDNDINILEMMMESLDKQNQLGELLSKKLFFTIDAQSKEDVLIKLIRRIHHVIPLPDDFYDSVIERESISSTAFSNKIAVPHPLTPDQFPDFISICKLKKPIMWDDTYVQFVFLISLSNHRDSVRIFFDRLSKIIRDKEIVVQLLKAKTYEAFIDIFLNEGGHV